MFFKNLFFRFNLLFLFLIGGFFVSANLVQAANTDIVINEIGAYESSDHEWVEIFNKGSEPVDLTGWKFYENATNHGLNVYQGDDLIVDPGEYAVIVDVAENFVADYPSFSGTIIDSSWSSLKESGEEIGLKDTEENMIEIFTYISATTFSLERADPNLADYTENNWQEHSSGNTIGLQNSNYGQEPDPDPDPDPDPEPEPDPDNLNIVINEIGAYESSGHEWIEIYNKGSEPIDVDGWKFYENDTNHGLNLFQGADLIIDPGEYAIIADVSENFSTDYPGFVGTIIDSSWSSLNESGEFIGLKDSSSEFVESFTYLPAPSFSLERKSVNLADYSENNWHEHSSGNTAGYQNSDGSSSEDDEEDEGEEDEEEDEGEEEQSSSGSEIKYYFPGDVVINEFVSDPADGEVEWIELYNNKDEDIDLNTWTLEEGSEVVTNLEGIIEANSFMVFEKPKGNLNNSGDIIILRYQSSPIDLVTYGEWNDGQMSDNAPKVSDPDSLARIQDGWDTNSDFNDFEITTTPTKGSKNIITTDDEEDFKSTNESYSKDIIINEVFPNPEGKDNEEEFIELKNIGEVEVNLLDWKLGDNSTKRYTINSDDLDTKIKPGEILVFKRDITNIALNNSGTEKAKLFYPNDKLVEEVEYSGSAKEDFSYSRDENGDWLWTSAVTGGEENVFDIINEPPEAIINAPLEVFAGQEVVFDASDSVDPEGDELNYFWNFGDGVSSLEINPAHIYVSFGTYPVSLTVIDSKGNEAKAEFKINVLGESGGFVYEDFDFISWGLVQITEFIPNPEGSDEAEFIELRNSSDFPIDLTGWTLDDGEGGSRAYKIKDLIIEPGQYLVFKREETKISLNNTFDSVRLFNPNEELVDQIDYGEVFEGLSFCLNDIGNWVWSSVLTPGEKNIIEELVLEDVYKKSDKKETKIVETTLEEVRDFDNGDKVRVKGIVSVEPGVLGSQIFYLSGSGIQIYMNKKDFPDLKTGDLVEVVGVLAESGGETRIKIAQKEDIIILENQNPPEPEEINTGDINEEKEGYLVTITGEIIEIRGSSIYIDDGSEEIKVYIKQSTGIKKSNLYEGDVVSVTGIVSQTKSGYRLLPRYQDDIKIEKEVSELDAQSDELVMGSNETQKIITYLTVTVAALFLILVSLIIKYKFFVKK